MCRWYDWDVVNCSQGVTPQNHHIRTKTKSLHICTRLKKLDAFKKIVPFWKYCLPRGNSMRICFIKHLSRAIVCQLIFHSVIWQGKFCRQKSEFQTACQKSCHPALHTSICNAMQYNIVRKVLQCYSHIHITACQKIVPPALHPGTYVENTRVYMIVYM